MILGHNEQRGQWGSRTASQSRSATCGSPLCSSLVLSTCLMIEAPVLLDLAAEQRRFTKARGRSRSPKATPGRARSFADTLATAKRFMHSRLSTAKALFSIYRSRPPAAANMQPYHISKTVESPYRMYFSAETGRQSVGAASLRPSSFQNQ